MTSNVRRNRANQERWEEFLRKEREERERERQEREREKRERKRIKRA